MKKSIILSNSWMRCPVEPSGKICIFYLMLLSKQVYYVLKQQHLSQIMKLLFSSYNNNQRIIFWQICFIFYVCSIPVRLPERSRLLFPAASCSNLLMNMLILLYFNFFSLVTRACGMCGTVNKSKVSLSLQRLWKERKICRPFLMSKHFSNTYVFFFFRAVFEMQT